MIKILDHEMAWCRKLAEQRVENTKAMGLEPNNINKTAFEANLEGVVGELGFFKWMGVYPVMDRYIDKYDCLYRGKKVDVKCISSVSLNLMVNKEKRDNTEIVAFPLMIWLGDSVDLLGYGTPKQLFTVENQLDWNGKRPAYMLNKDLLKKFDEQP